MTERVLLIDVDSKIPNLALMKLSTYHKGVGDEVGFNVSDPTKIYASTVFTKNRHKTDGLRFFYPNAEIDIGGSGIDITKELDIDDLTVPDYSLYPSCDYDLGFTSRGCIRHCYFCIVHDKEGKFRRVQHPSEFHDPDHKKAMFLDNNILADKKWFFSVTDWLLNEDISVDINQGLDVRLLDREIADRLAELKHFKPWKFAFDDMSVRQSVEDGIGILKSAGINTRQNVIFYVYMHGDSQFADGLKRCEILRSHHVGAFPMYNQSAPRTQRMTDLKRWAIPYIFWTADYYEYKKGYKNKTRRQSQ